MNLDTQMTTYDISILDNLRKLHHEVATRLARESEDYRLVVALRQTIQWLERRDNIPGRPEHAEAPGPGEQMPAIEILAALARRGTTRRSVSSDGLSAFRNRNAAAAATGSR